MAQASRTTATVSVPEPDTARLELANRLFFRLYQCANMLHKTGTRAVEEQGLTTQQWAVMGALSRPGVQPGMGVGDLARYLLVTRQNLTVLLARMVRNGHVVVATNTANRRAKLVSLTPVGWRVWEREAQPKIAAYYGAALDGFSVNDMAHTLHYLLLLLENMKQVDATQSA